VLVLDEEAQVNPDSGIVERNKHNPDQRRHAWSIPEKGGPYAYLYEEGYT